LTKRRRNISDIGQKPVKTACRVLFSMPDMKNVICLSLALISAIARAQPLPIVNPGFEANATVNGAFIAVLPTGWTLYDPLGIIDQNANAVGVIRPQGGQSFFPAGAPEGSQAALLFLAGAQPGPAGLQQTLVSTLLANTQYSLSVAVGNIGSGTSLPGSSDGGGVFYNLAGFPGYRLELLAGGVLLAADHNSIGATIPEGEFRTANLVFNSGAAPAQLGLPLSLRLINLDIAGTALAPAIEVDFDNVQLTASPVPEPAAFGLWCLGLLLVAGHKLHQRRLEN
jgi:hapalindole H/12-epi-hapalindole U/12-epi-fischerindole U synthase